MNSLADNARVAPETPLPITVADDANRMFARRSIIPRRNRPPQRRVDAQHLIIVSAHELPVNSRFRLTIHTHGQAQRMVSQHAGERPVVIPDLLVIAEREAVAVLARVGVTEQDESLRVFDRQIFQKDRIHDTKDCRVRADAQRQQEHSHAGKTRVTPQHSQRIAYIPRQRFQMMSRAYISDFLFDLFTAPEFYQGLAARLRRIESLLDLLLD